MRHQLATTPPRTEGTLPSKPRRVLRECARPVIALDTERPSAPEFLLRINRALHARYSEKKSVASHRHAITTFVRWLGKPPHQALETDVRDFLEFMLDGGAAWSWVSTTLSSIRTGFDRLCGCSITDRVQPPPGPRTHGPILSTREIAHVLKAAPSLYDKLLIGLSYATGLRPSDVVRIRWRDVETGTSRVSVRVGRSSAKRRIDLPSSFRPLFERFRQDADPKDHLFGTGERDRCASIESVHRAIKRAFAIAGVDKASTPGMVRRTFATHLLDHDADIRFVHRLLGPMKLDATTLYASSPPPTGDRVTRPRAPTPVGQLRIELGDLDDESPRPCAAAALIVTGPNQPVRFDGITVSEIHPGCLALELPLLEDWDEPLSSLTQEQRARFREAGFYALLRRELATRFQGAYACS
jgi:site-specific recombinase XerD